MVGVHSVRRRGRFISPVYVCCCFVVGNSLCSCMFVSFSGCECICGHDKSAYTVGVLSVYGGYRSIILHRIFYEMCGVWLILQAIFLY